MRHRLSNLAHRFGHWVDPATQPLCVCRAASFIEGIKARRPSSPVAHSPEELRAYIAQRESGVAE